ncbi:Clp protease N-terminal domain-containing protein [Candidatus Odyssella thessalonicensis]|uniref:Clp protease N-terminal domain-containing protein n=1 Tax=Candidatus Odyssella thessalonicensis TaxID=84647 RepID=UPI000225C08A|nr:Clp protease N-terminal domain-containing protein [Candidatus Odyssella thessalonicensis]
MMEDICEVCNKPATVGTQVVMNGWPRQMELCDTHYFQLVDRYSKAKSPLSSLSSKELNIFDGLFDENFFPSPFSKRCTRATIEEKGAAILSGNRAGASVGQLEDNLNEQLSTEAEKVLQAAAYMAREAGRHKIDAEHLLYALIGNDIAHIIFEQFKLSVDRLKRQLEAQACHNRSTKN